MSDLRKQILKYGIATTVAGGMTALTLHLHGYAEAATLVDRYKILADAFTIPGVVLVMLAALIWVSTTGFFDGLSYAARQFGSLIIPLFGKKYTHLTYYDYKMDRDEKRAHGYAFLFFVGLVFVIVAVVFTILHSRVYVPMN